MCQEFVAAAIESTHYKHPESYVLHYTDNILISHLSESTAYIGNISSEELFNLFLQLCSLVETHIYLFFVSHLCSLSNLPSPLDDGNTQADKAVSGLALSLPTLTVTHIEAA
jgi:hypothetical protein